MQLAAADRIRRRNRADDSARERRDGGAIREAAQDYSELVPANARNLIALTHVVGESSRHCLKQGVAEKNARELH